jgi:DNA-binding transcriptional regulator YhcF (GntR family)
MPSIDQICQESGRSRQTVGKALRALEREGMIVRVGGHPYYVNDAPDVSGRSSRVSSVTRLLLGGLGALDLHAMPIYGFQLSASEVLARSVLKPKP